MTGKYRASGASHALAAVVIAVAGCATPPPPKPASYITLLADHDGKVGSVIVTGAQGSTTLNQADTSARLDSSPGQPYAVEPRRFQQDFAAALAAEPARARNFILYFDTATTRLTAESTKQLEVIASAVRDHPAPDISITGHTDTAGPQEDNERLALERARFVHGLIRSSGLNVLSVEVTSHGERNLLVATPDNTSEPRNRRVEVTVR